MALVRTKYAGELAVLSTWLCAFLPWSVTVGVLEAGGGSISVIWLRFLPLRFLYILGGSLPGESPVIPVWSVPGFVQTSGETTAAWLWIGGLVVFLVPLGLSVVYYLDEERMESLPVDPVRLQGGLLLLVGGVFAAASAPLVMDLPGTTIPLGTLFFLGFGVLLLRVERVEADGPSE